jgi:hypothetical protein
LYAWYQIIKGQPRCMKLPLCAGPEKGRTTWGLCNMSIKLKYDSVQKSTSSAPSM